MCYVMDIIYPTLDPILQVRVVSVLCRVPNVILCDLYTYCCSVMLKLDPVFSFSFFYIDQSLFNQQRGSVECCEMRSLKFGANNKKALYDIFSFCQVGRYSELHRRCEKILIPVEPGTKMRKIHHKYMLLSVIKLYFKKAIYKQHEAPFLSPLVSLVSHGTHHCSL